MKITEQEIQTADALRESDQDFRDLAVLIEAIYREERLNEFRVNLAVRYGKMLSLNDN